MMKTRKRTLGLTIEQARILRMMYLQQGKRGTPQLLAGVAELGWCRPTDLGGTMQSTHSETLRGVASKGFVDSRPYISPTAIPGRISYARMYRISPIGISAWELYAEHVHSTQRQL